MTYASIATPAGRVRVLECLAPWLCISAARPVGPVGSGAARQNQEGAGQQQQGGGQQQQQGPGEPAVGWLRDTRPTPPDRSRPHSAPLPITTTTMVKTFQVRKITYHYW